MDIIVTVPKSELSNLKKEDEYGKNNDITQFWAVARVPKKLNKGDKVYFIENNMIHYYHIFLGIAKDIQCEVTNRAWTGYNLILQYPETQLHRAIPMKGFQGFRYMNAIDGWLSPEGTLIGCTWGEHIKFAERILGRPSANPDHILIKSGWIKLTSSENLSIGYGWWPEDTYKVTQAQYDAIYEWCKENKAIYPRWWEAVEVI